jgi:hypothetical protein
MSGLPSQRGHCPAENPLTSTCIAVASCGGLGTARISSRFANLEGDEFHGDLMPKELTGTRERWAAFE